MNLVSLVQQHEGGSRALHDGAGWRTWSEVRSGSEGVSRKLKDMGIRPGDRVAIAWPNSSEFVLAYLGVLAAGAVVVPMNPNSPLPELRRELEIVGAATLIAGGAAAELAPALAETSRGLRVVTDPVGEAEGREGSETFEPVERNDDDIAALLFTSGTAGAPRAAMLTHGNLAANLRQMLAIPDIQQRDDVTLAAVPMFHVFGLNVALGLSLATGAAVVLQERFDPRESIRSVEEHGVTTLAGVPTMFAAWAELTDSSASSSLSGVRRAISGAAALSADVAESFENRYGVPVWQGYGLTEASPAVSTALGTGRNRAGSVGKPLPGVEVRIVDEAGDESLDGDPGEIWVRGPNVFAGYWEDGPATSEALTKDGWLRTGDVGVIGDDGDLYVVDRLKDMAIVSGFNVYPAEVERVIAELPGVSGVVVVGRPDDFTGESIEAVVVRSQGASVTEDDVRRHCAANLARYKCPSTVRFVPELPTGLAGKALRRAVRAQTA